MSNETIWDYINAWSKLPSYALMLLENLLEFLIYMAIIIGLILIMWGSIEWATSGPGFERRGTRRIINGVILLLIALAPKIIH